MELSLQAFYSLSRWKWDQRFLRKTHKSIRKFCLFPQMLWINFQFSILKAGFIPFVCAWKSLSRLVFLFMKIWFSLSISKASQTTFSNGILGRVGWRKGKDEIILAQSRSFHQNQNLISLVKSTMGFAFHSQLKPFLFDPPSQTLTLKPPKRFRRLENFWFIFNSQWKTFRFIRLALAQGRLHVMAIHQIDDCVTCVGEVVFDSENSCLIHLVNRLFEISYLVCYLIELINSYWLHFLQISNGNKILKIVKRGENL